MKGFNFGFSLGTPSNQNNARQIEAEESLRLAIHAESGGHYAEALNNYEKSLEIWLALLKSENDPSQKREITSIFQLYVERAENVKVVLESEKEKQKQKQQQTLPITSAIVDQHIIPTHSSIPINDSKVPDIFDYTPEPTKKRTQKNKT